MITKDIGSAIKALEENKVVAIPTETVYGLAGNAYEDKALRKIFEIKKRPHYNPLIVHIKGAEALCDVAEDIPKKAVQLAEVFWPGALTLVLKKKSHIPDLVTAGKNTVAVRVPNHKLTLQLLDGLAFPLAAPSANPFGSISPTSAEHVFSYFKHHLDVILDGGACEKGLESTIIGFEGQTPILYRRGAIALEAIEKVIGKVAIHKTSADKSPEAPGMLSRHYAPNTRTILVENLTQFLKTTPNERIGVLSFQNKVENISVAHQEVLSPDGNLEEAARNLYAALHRLDHLNLELIIAEKLPKKGLGLSINDKLRRAAEKRIKN